MEYIKISANGVNVVLGITEKKQIKLLQNYSIHLALKALFMTEKKKDRAL